MITFSAIVNWIIFWSSCIIWIFQLRFFKGFRNFISHFQPGFFESWIVLKCYNTSHWRSLQIIYLFFLSWFSFAFFLLPVPSPEKKNFKKKKNSRNYPKSFFRSPHSRLSYLFPSIEWRQVRGTEKSNLNFRFRTCTVIRWAERKVYQWWSMRLSRVFLRLKGFLSGAKIFTRCVTTRIITDSVIRDGRELK